MIRIRTLLQTIPARLLLYIGLPMLLAVGLAGKVVMGALERQFERRMQEDVEMVARALQKPVSHALERQRHGSLRSALESALDIGRVYGAYLYNEQGTLLASLATFEPPHREPADAAELRHRHRGGGSYGSIRGEPVYSYYVPVRLGGPRGTGLLRITRRKADIDIFMAQLRTMGIALMLALALVMAATAFLGYRRAAGAAFQRLRGSIARIRAGDRSHRAEVWGPHEVRIVVQELNSMLDSIESAEQRLERGRTERLELQAKLGASEKLASIGRLAAGIAHELGTPLGTVAGRLQRLRRRRDLAESMARELREMAGEVRRMEELVREVLDFGRRDRLRCVRIAASEILSTVRTTLIAQKEAPRNGRFELDGPAATIFLEADPSRLEQALVNLIRNAVQVSPAARVRASWYSTGEHVCFAVEDDGPGVPVENRQRIFEPFFTDRQGGTGLGLAIVAAVAHEHGGQVTVGTSELGGARFELTLPMRAHRGPALSHAAQSEERNINAS